MKRIFEIGAHEHTELKREFEWVCLQARVFGMTSGKERKKEIMEKRECVCKPERDVKNEKERAVIGFGLKEIFFYCPKDFVFVFHSLAIPAEHKDCF